MTERDRVFILESHPVQYHAPVYRAACDLAPGLIKVVYATDCSVRGHHDPEFGRRISWDTPLLEGYPVQVLNSERGEPLRGPWSLHGRDIVRLLWNERPRAVIFTQLAYEFEWAAYLTCLVLRIDIWIRTETQDAAFERGWFKSAVRSLLYRALYAPMKRVFYIGKLNRDHFLGHGVPASRLLPSRYCVVDRLKAVSDGEKRRRRQAKRAQLGIEDNRRLVAFFGKLIPKKNPGALFKACGRSRGNAAADWHLLFVGDGELRDDLESLAVSTRQPAHFAGFVNQSGLDDYYLAADVVVLPSRRAGETWGLVVNEALHAGCGVIVSSAVGCAADFGTWARVRVVSEHDDGDALAQAITELGGLARDFNWCRKEMAAYSVEAAAAAIAQSAESLLQR